MYMYLIDLGTSKGLNYFFRTPSLFFLVHKRLKLNQWTTLKLINVLKILQHRLLGNT